MVIKKYSYIQFTGEYKRKRMPNIRSLGGIYYGVDTDQQCRTFDFYTWEEWNCRRCKFDLLTNKKESEKHLHENKLPPLCDEIQADLLINMFEGKDIPYSTFTLLGMNKYGVGTCALFEEYKDA